MDDGARIRGRVWITTVLAMDVEASFNGRGGGGEDLVSWPEVKVENVREVIWSGWTE